VITLERGYAPPPTDADADPKGSRLKVTTTPASQISRSGDGTLAASTITIGSGGFGGRRGG
jgi:hypothetical protein